jgi:hypothetical protein
MSSIVAVRDAATAVTAPFRSASLDRRLAAGAPPDGFPALARRALRLESGPFRRRLADQLEALLTRRSSTGAWTAAVPPLWGEVHANRALVRELARRLREADHVDARGVALVRELLVDGAGPVFVFHGPGAMADALSDALVHLHAR